MMKKIILAAMLTATVGSAMAQDTVRMTLDSCLRYAYSHNITVQSAEMSRQSAEASLEGAKMKFTPTLSASASENMSVREGTATFDNNLGLNANMTLFNGLNTLNSYKQSKLQAEQSTLQVAQSKNSIANQIIQAYLTILMNEERLQYQQDVLNTSEQQKLEGELKYSVGKILESDYLLLAANYQSALSDIENTRLTIENNRLALKSLLCMTGKTAIAVVNSRDSLKADSFELPSLDTVLRRAYDTLPDLKIAQMSVDIAQYNVKIAQGGYSPTIGLNAGANYYGGNNSVVDESGTVISNGGVNSSANLSMSIPIFNKGTNRTQLKQSKIALQEAQLNYDQKVLDLQKEIEGQYLSTEQTLNQFKASEMLEDAYKKSYDVYVIKYGEGAVTTVDMLQQQDKYLSALNTYLQNKYSFVLNMKLLDMYQGNEIRL